MSHSIQRILVWPTIIRVLHLLMVATVLVLLVTGGFLQSNMIANEGLYLHLLEIWHLPAGHILAVVLVIRFILLIVSSGVASWRALIPKNIKSILHTVRFYLALARMKLPSYFAHNPFWKLLYLLMFILLSLQVFYGLLIEFSWLRSVTRLDSLLGREQHSLLFVPIFSLVIAHVVTVILHDLKTETGEVSSMINGYKHFTFDAKSKKPNVEMPVTVSLDNLFIKK